jgi:malonyl-CoA O-methyltransferase
MDVERLTLEYSDVFSLMRDLKGIGSHNVARDRSRGLTGKTQLETMLKAYEQFRRNDRYPASFEVIYGTAFAPSDGQPMKTLQGDVASFSVDALRSSARKRNPQK